MSYTGSVPATIAFPVQYFSGNVSGSYALTYPAASTSAILVSIDGKHAYSNTYSASGNALVFNIGSYPPLGALIEVLWLGLPTITENLQNFTSISMSSTVSGLTFTPGQAVPPSASFSLDGTVNVASGGTGASIFGLNQIVTGPTALGGPLAVLPSGSAGQLLTSAGTGLAPSWTDNIVRSFSAGLTGLTPTGTNLGTIVLGGTLNVASGGTSGTAFPANQVLLGNNTSAFTSVGNATNGGDVLASTGLNNAPQYQEARRISRVLPGTTGLTITEGPTPAVAGSISSPVSFQATIGGTLNVSNGGTGAVTLPINRLLLGNTLAPVNALGSGTAGQVLMSGGLNNAPVWGQAVPIGVNLAAVPIGGPVFGPTSGVPTPYPLPYGTTFTVNGTSTTLTVAGVNVPNGVYASYGSPALPGTFATYIRVS